MILGHRYAPLVFGAAALAALAAWLTLFRSSPGELSAPHQKVAGSSFIGNCRKCHKPEGLSKGCLSCHSEIAAQLEGHRGYHGRLTGKKSGNCTACHSEHNGRDFALINKVSWGGADPAAYTHAHTTFTLAGAHARLACADCHVKKAPAFSLPRFRKQKRPSTYLGLRQDCSSCHSDPHAGGRAAGCAACHTQDKFKPAKNFDHDKFYPLRDAHARVACAKCHKTDAAAAPDKVFGAVAGRTCQACHATPHRAAWNAACSDCHTARAVPWTEARSRMSKALHAATGFRLEKPHERTRCAACHDPAKPYSWRHPRDRARSQKNCAACHRDVHAGQFPRRTCLDCHAETAFSPSRYTARQHAAVYPLDGAHAKAACGACHIYDEGLKAVRYADTRKDCAFCHKDPHAGQFRGQGGRTTCEKCHRDVTSWRKTRFDHNTMSSFKLSSAHAKVACRACHPEARTSTGRRVTLYKPLKHACNDCHAPPQ